MGDLNQITFVTQLTPDRLERLRKVAETWSGPMAANFYVAPKKIAEFMNAYCTDPVLQLRKNIQLHITQTEGVCWNLSSTQISAQLLWILIGPTKSSSNIWSLGDLALFLLRSSCSIPPTSWEILLWSQSKLITSSCVMLILSPFPTSSPSCSAISETVTSPTTR